MAECKEHGIDGCECERSDFTLDHAALREAAKALGVKQPVTFKVRKGMKLRGRCRSALRRRRDGAFARRRLPLFHRIAVRGGMSARQTCLTLRHELEHALQAERLYGDGYARMCFIWKADYDNDPLEKEANEAALREWVCLGHCLRPTTTNGGTK
jgi:hypothetical protein